MLLQLLTHSNLGVSRHSGRQPQTGSVSYPLTDWEWFQGHHRRYLAQGTKAKPRPRRYPREPVGIGRTLFDGFGVVPLTQRYAPRTIVLFNPQCPYFHSLSDTTGMTKHLRQQRSEALWKPAGPVYGTSPSDWYMNSQEVDSLERVQDVEPLSLSRVSSQSSS